MKKEILTLIIGILIGAIITTVVFMVVKPNNGNERPNLPGNFTEFGNFSKFDGERPSRPDGSNRPSRSSKKIENNTVKDDTNEE